MRINLASVLVDDQDKALRFYTEILGFVKKTDVPVGEARWLTVVSPDDPDGTELLLEPDGHPAAKPFKQALAMTAFPTRRSPSTTSKSITSDCARWGSGSRRSRSRRSRSPRPCSMTRAGT